ncbi:hypothetical protein Tco_0468800, partial [Tanacetum coccineum]
MFALCHKEEQQLKKVETNQIRIEKELQKEDALRRNVDTDDTKVASSGTDSENQSGSVDGFMSKRVTSMSTSRVATIWKLLRVSGLRLQIYEGLATSEGGLVLSMEGQSREAINATNILSDEMGAESVFLILFVMIWMTYAMNWNANSESVSSIMGRVRWAERLRYLTKEAPDALFY